MEEIFAFCDLKIGSRETPYKAKRFWDPSESGLASLLAEARNPREGHETTPKEASVDVNRANHGETAFQRALYYHEGKQVLDGEEIQWVDIELPITFSAPQGGRARRRCVDLIAYTEKFGHFLCELKYASNGHVPPANGADYAILEALIYLGIVKKNFVALDKNKVWRGKRLPFKWEEIARGNRVLVLANTSFWESARKEEKRIKLLCWEIRRECGVDLMLCEAKDAVLGTKAGPNPDRVIPTLGNGQDLMLASVFG
jgi:hypothetical protein